MQEAQLGEESTRQSSIRRQSSRKKNNSALHRGLRHVTNCLASPWTWTSGIFLLGIGDLACKWINLLALADERLQYGLLIGPVASNLWNIQLGFTIVATVLYLPEVINTMSAYCSGGETKAPLDYEMIVLFALIHTPLSIINFAIHKTRDNYETSTQLAAGIVRVLYTFARILWHAQIEGNKMYKKMENQVSNVVIFLMVCLVFAISSAFPIMSWMGSRSNRGINEYTSPVGIYVLQQPYPTDGSLPDPFISLMPRNNVTFPGGTHVLNSTSLPPPLVPTVARIISDPYRAYTLDCLPSRKSTSMSQQMPSECGDAPYLRFIFQYDAQQSPPYGGLRYNFAQIYPDNLNPRNTRCVPLKQELSNGWTLFYLRAQHNTLRPPWFNLASTAPIPKYDRKLTVCIKD